MATEQSIGSLQLKQPGYTFYGGGLSNKLSQVLSNVIGFITLVAAIAFIFYFMIGTINWITSAGDATKAQKARTIIMNALIGLVIAVIAYPLASILGRLFGVSFTSPRQLLNSLF